MTLLQGKKDLVEAILAPYTEASQRICSECGFNNLAKRSTKCIWMLGLIESKGKSNFCLVTLVTFALTKTLLLLNMAIESIVLFS
jgi:hypothetical protein